MINITKSFVIMFLLVILAISISKNDVSAISALVRSDESAVPLKSFKLSENVIYDCIDIYKQPGLDHSLLKNHTIQMKSSASRHDFKNRTDYNKAYEKKITCPDGTVPIMRNTKNYNTNIQRFAEKYFHLLTSDSPGTHIAGVRSRDGPFHGIEAWFDEYTLNVGNDQTSYSSISIGSGVNNQFNFIHAGWMINPNMFGDARVWSYGFWKGKDGNGCYNTICPGFVQVSQEVPLSEPSDVKPGKPGLLRLSIHQDIHTGNWWITQLLLNAPDIDIGYWPKELFNLLDNGASIVGAGGLVQSSPSGLGPPMGNGKFPVGDHEESATFSEIKVLDSKYEKNGLNYYTIEHLQDSKCYGLIIGGKLKSPRPLDFKYGGPGGTSCGI